MYQKHCFTVSLILTVYLEYIATLYLIRRLTKREKVPLCKKSYICPTCLEHISYTVSADSVPLWSLQLRDKSFIDLYYSVCCLLYKIYRFILYSWCIAEIANSWVLLLHVSVPTCLLQLRGRN